MFKSTLKFISKSKIFRYSAIAAALVTTSGVLLSSSNILQSPTEAQPQIQSQPQAKPEILTQAPNRLDRSENADMPSGKVLKQLNLSTEQLQKLKAIRDRDLARIRELSQQSRQANKELRDLLAGTESSDMIRTKHNQVLALQQELRSKHFERMLAMREILTPQQRSQLNEIMQKNRRNGMRDGIKENIKNRMEKRMENLRDRATL
jgi:Spy/CpxP family protein refolding chaperone